MKRINVSDREFELFLSSDKIHARIRELANEISNDLKDKDPVFIGIMNGAFMFASDLFKNLEIDAQISFVKLSSYHKMASTGKVQQSIGLNMDIKDMNIVILEDIIDTGNTLLEILAILREYQPASVRIVTLLFKPGKYKQNIPPDYIGFSIPDKFVVGYGLDYNGFGRKYADIYTVVNNG